MYVCLFVCLFVCMYVCMYVMCVSMYLSIYVSIFACMHVLMRTYLHACMLISAWCCSRLQSGSRAPAANGEVTLKVVGLGRAYVWEAWNVFDLVIVSAWLLYRPFIQLHTYRFVICVWILYVCTYLHVHLCMCIYICVYIYIYIYIY